MWTLPILLLAITILISIPLSKYFVAVMGGRFSGLRRLRWSEARLNAGEQNCKQYTISLIVFNAMLFMFGFVALCLQPIAPPTASWHAGAVDDLQYRHLVHDEHQPAALFGRPNLSNFSQIFFILPNMFLSASVGFCALTAIIRAFRGQKTLGNYFVDMWRVAICIHLPAALIVGTIFMQQGMPMTYASEKTVTTLETNSMGNDSSGHANPQNIIVGPVAAVIPIKMLGANGGDFYGMNSAAPLENPTAISNFVTTFAMMIVPALFAGTLPWLTAIDIMHLHSPTSAILLAVIFNALIIPLLIPVALKGVRYRPLGVDALLRRNLLIWGVGGVIAPVIGIS